MRGLFVTGTDTEVGKTYVAALIARRLNSEGIRVGVYKPVASGCLSGDEGLVSEDAEILWEHAGYPESVNDVCPQMFAKPIAPHLAARAEGRLVDEQKIWDGFEFWHGRCDFLIVEGAGGLMSPLSDNLYNLDVAERLGLPMIVVAANRLGTINATLLTLLAANSRRSKVRVAGVVLNQTRSSCEDESLASNASEIGNRAGVPLLAQVTHGGDLPDGRDWSNLVSSH